MLKLNATAQLYTKKVDGSSTPPTKYLKQVRDAILVLKRNG